MTLLVQLHCSRPLYHTGKENDKAMRLLADLSIRVRHRCLHPKSVTGESYFPSCSHLNELRYSQSFICSERKNHKNRWFYSGLPPPPIDLPFLTDHYNHDIFLKFLTNWQSRTQIYNQFCLWLWRREQKYNCSQHTKLAQKRGKVSFYRAHPYILYKSHKTSDKTQVPFFPLRSHNICQRVKWILSSI